MEEPHKWERSRYLALLIVSALHVTLVIALLIAAKTRLLLISIPSPIELLALPPNTAPQTAVPPPAISNRSKRTTPPAVPPSSAIAIDAQAAAAEIAGAAVDWVQEAQIVAGDTANRSPAERRQESALIASPQSPFSLPPAHHKGEQFPTGDGQWIVYVSDDCYQVSKSITSITNATNNGMSLQTYCSRHSKVPRGDLFKELPAYKKHHPDN